MKFFSNADNAQQNLQSNSLAPVFTDLYTNAEMTAKLPYIPALKDSLSTAIGRPQVVKYGDATSAIQDNAYAAITKAKTVDQALADMQKKLEEVTKK